MKVEHIITGGIIGEAKWTDKFLSMYKQLSLDIEDLTLVSDKKDWQSCKTVNDLPVAVDDKCSFKLLKNDSELGKYEIGTMEIYPYKSSASITFTLFFEIDNDIANECLQDESKIPLVDNLKGMVNENKLSFYFSNLSDKIVGTGFGIYWFFSKKKLDEINKEDYNIITLDRLNKKDIKSFLKENKSKYE